MSSDFVSKRRVHFHEVDYAGVLYFGNYYKYMEEAEHNFFRTIGLPILPEPGRQETVWPRVASSCEYMSPARFEDELTMLFRVVKIGTRSVTYEVEFRNAVTRTALGRMTAAHCVAVDGTFRPAPIPDSIRNKLESALGTSS